MCQDYFYNYFEFKLPSLVHIETFKTWMSFPCGSACKESACNVGDLGLIPGLGRPPWKRERLRKILQEMGIPDHLICLLRNLYAGQEATVRTGHGTTDWFQIGKAYIKAVYYHPAYLTDLQNTS